MRTFLDTIAIGLALLSTATQARAADEILRGHGSSVLMAEFDPSSNLVASCSGDSTVRIWNATNGALVHILRHNAPVTGLAFAPLGDKLVTFGFDGAKVWNPLTGALLHSLTGHNGRVRWGDIDRLGTRVVTAGFDNTARIWDLNTGVAGPVLTGHTQMLFSVSFSPDGTRVATSSFDETANIYDAMSGALLHKLERHTQRVQGAVFSPDNETVVTYGFEGGVHVWEVATGQYLRSLEGHRARVNWVEFNPDGTRILTAAFDSTARIFNAATGALVRALTAHTDNVIVGRYSNDGSRIVTSGYDGAAHVVDAESGEPIRSVTPGSRLNWVDFSTNGERIVTAGFDTTARIFDLSPSSVGDDAAHSNPDRNSAARVYPNPVVGNEFIIELSHAPSGVAHVDIVDVRGTVVATARYQGDSGDAHHVRFDRSGLPAGTYYARYRNGSHEEFTPFTIIE